MQDRGYIFYPHNCLLKSCNLHLSLHGCFGGTDYWAKDGTGMMNYAAANDIILLFPYVHNCYDTRGNTGVDFATNKGT